LGCIVNCGDISQLLGPWFHPSRSSSMFASGMAEYARNPFHR
jgi:hypothetical protein